LETLAFIDHPYGDQYVVERSYAAAFPPKIALVIVFVNKQTFALYSKDLGAFLSSHEADLQVTPQYFTLVRLGRNHCLHHKHLIFLCFTFWYLLGILGINKRLTLRNRSAI